MSDTLNTITPVKVSAEEIYKALKDDFRFIGADGFVKFNLRDYSIVVEQNNVVGNILEEWLAKWFVNKGFDHIHNHRQSLPDFWLDKDNLCEGWLEVKSFTVVLILMLELLEVILMR